MFGLPVILLAASPVTAFSQQDRPASGTQDFRLALIALERGDTTAAIERLRAVVRDDPDYGPAFLRLGSVLSSRSSEVEREFGDRWEAERLLERAYRLLGPDPEVLLEYGLLLRKQHVRVDAKRVLDRAWEAASDHGRSMSAADRARMHYALGLIYQAWWEDWDGLVMDVPTAPPISCSGIAWGGGPDEASPVLCPESWADWYEHTVPLADLKSEEREHMQQHFLLALEADPGHTDAAVAAMGHLAEGGQWGRYEEIARGLLSRRPDDPQAHLFYALGLHQRGRDDEAEIAFKRGLDLLPTQERHVFEDVGELLPPEERERYRAAGESRRAEFTRMVLAGKDPLYLTEANERELEHYARLAWAELKFSAPASGLRGWESDRGRIWVRYGQPWRSAMCCYGGGGRRIFWSYSRMGPLFMFDRNLTYRRARFEPKSAALAEALGEVSPEAYTPVTVTDVHGIPHQVARFRGGGAATTRVEIYAAPPLDSLRVAPGTRLEAGIFTFLDDLTPVWQRKTTTDVTERGIGLTYRMELPRGTFRYSLEARRAGPDSLPRPIARERSTVITEGYPDGQIAVSDILLAEDTVRARSDAPVRREDLAIAPSRSTTVGVGEPLHLYFEVYGLRADSGELGVYRAELAVEDSTRRNFAERLFSAGRAFLGFGEDEDETGVSWERQTPVVDDVVPEYVSVDVPDLDPGTYAIRIRIVDLATNEEAESVRRIRVVRGS